MFTNLFTVDFREERGNSAVRYNRQSYTERLTNGQFSRSQNLLDVHIFKRLNIVIDQQSTNNNYIVKDSLLFRHSGNRHNQNVNMFCDNGPRDG